MSNINMEKFRSMTMREFDDFLYNELNDITNIDLIILRGHIITETLLNLYLESISQVDNSDFSKENFSFEKKVKIAKHFGHLGSKDDNLINELFLLNKLRNSIAHTLTINKTYLYEFFTELVKKNPSIKGYTDERNKLIASIAFISGAIQGAYKLKTNPEEFNKYLKED